MKKFTIKINEDNKESESVKSLSKVHLENIKSNLEFIINEFGDLDNVPAWVSDKISVTNHHMEAIEGWIRSSEKEALNESYEEVEKTLKHYLYDEDDNIIEEYDFYDKNKIKEDIIKYLNENPEGSVSHQKQLSEEDSKKYAGNDVLNFYEVNPKTGDVSLVVSKGSREFYKSIE